MAEQQSNQNKYFDTKALKTQGNDMIDLITNLYDNIENVPVQPQVEPGFLRAQFPDQPPKKGEDINDILKETREKIFPGITQWQHPGFFAYYPSCTSHVAVLADMFSTTFNSPAFVFNASPSHTEIENITVDWFAQLLSLPEQFLLKNTGGGSFQTSISDALFNSIHAAKRRKMKELNLTYTNPDILKFVGYYTEHSFQACEKSLMLKDIAHQRVIPVYFDEKVKNLQPDMDKFKQMLEEDVQNGLIPFFINATIGTTPSGAVDPIDEIGQLAKKYKTWYNIDAAYAGVSWVCEEFRHTQRGLEHVDSILINCAKSMLIGLNGAIIYVKDKKQFQQMFQMETMKVIENPYSSRDDCVDYSNWMVGFGRRCNSLKLFYVMKYFGQEGLQNFIRSKVKLANYFRELVDKSEDFEILTEQGVALNCFRYIGKYDKEKDLDIINQKTGELKKLLDQNSDKGYLVTSMMGGIAFVRLVVCNPNTTKEHIDQYWEYIQEQAAKL